MLATSALTDNAVSFVNTTDKRLHIRKIDGKPMPESTAAVIGDDWIASLDEQPITQAIVNDSRSHIMSISATGQGGTGGVDPALNSSLLSFNRNDLVLDTDEAFFVNVTDVSGAMDITATFNLWYQA